MTENTWPSPEDGIPLEDLVHRHIYKIRSRNLFVGVWNETTQGFIGIRLKFASKYLDTEYEWNTGGSSGTAYALGDTGDIVPDDIPMRQRLDSVCSETNRKVVFTTPVASGGKGWVYADDNEPIIGTPRSVPNTALFELLTPYDDKFTAEYAKQTELKFKR